MRVLITGARGNFATALIPRLAAAGVEMMLFDLEPMDAPEGSASYQGDIRDGAAIVHAMQGCDAIVHAAGLNPSAEPFRNYDDFFGVNVTGTQNVLRAMLLNDVNAMVYSSSDGVYGEGMRGLRIMDEDVPCQPTGFEPMTRLLAERLCEFYAHHHKIATAILRYGSFEPADWRSAGVGRLANWLDREDVAQANELALGAVIAGEFECEHFLIHCAKPFTDDDWPELATNPQAVIERYYPGAVDDLHAANLHVPFIHTRYDISKAVSVLGYEPQQNFDQFLVRLRSHTQQ